MGTCLFLHISLNSNLEHSGTRQFFALATGKFYNFSLGCIPMVIGPYYFGMDQEKLFIYYDRLAKEAGGDIYLYSYPPRTGHSLEPQTISKLVRNNPNIKGIKESISEPNHTNLICRAVEGCDFTVYSGYDDQFLTNAANGGGGCIGAFSIIVPELWSDLIGAYNQKNFISR